MRFYPFLTPRFPVRNGLDQTGAPAPDVTLDNPSKTKPFWKMKNRFLHLVAAFCAFISSTSAAFAFEPKPGQIGMQPAASPSMMRLENFHNDILLWIIGGIVVFVFFLLLWVVLRYNAKSNPVPSKTTHHVLIEVIWTIVPVLILIGIAVPSYKLLYYLDRTAEPDMTIKTIGSQWYWTYEYQYKASPDAADFQEFSVESRMIKDDELNEYIPDGKGRRMLETYNPIVVPTEKNIQLLTTASDVIHSWALPAFGIKKDAVPGRINETWFRVTEPGIYYGQCSEICGIDHAAMPISIYAVPADEYEAWVMCMTVDDSAEKDADYPARACVQKLGFDKYRSQQKGHRVTNLYEQQKTEAGVAAE